MTKPRPIRVMIVDDHDMVRLGLSSFLRIQPDLELVGEAANGREAVELCERVRPDVILMDLVMPELDGTAATRTIRERWPEVQVIALTSFIDKSSVEEALEAGAIGYVLKNVSTDQLASVIRSAHAGRSTLAPEATRTLARAERLERLGRALVDAPPNAYSLREVLRKHIPDMFSDSQVAVQMFTDPLDLYQPAGGWLIPDLAWEWLRITSEAHSFPPGATLPWGDTQPAGSALVLAPIIGVGNGESIGGICVQRHREPGAAADLLPYVKSLATQISSAMHGAEIHAQTLAHQRIARELAMAGQIQASFLPAQLPEVAGWQLAATVRPAKETSGDFYDFIHLPNGRLGIVIADVAGKGMGAALYMALCRTLIRTYAIEFDVRPDLVLDAANRRILSDTGADLFVTLFYGILDPATGALTYCNAGHNPPYLLSATKGDLVQILNRTGMALGAIEEATWQPARVELNPGDVLVLYTDGITEALDEREVEFGGDRLLEIAQKNLGRPAEEMQNALIAAVRSFMGSAPQFDDMTLVVVSRHV